MTYQACLSTKHDISTRKNNMLSSHVKRTLLLWLHVVLPFSIKKMLKKFFNFECSGMESGFKCFLVVQDGI